MFNSFKKNNIITELQILSRLLLKEINNLKKLEDDDIPLEIKKEKINEAKIAIDTIQTQVDKLKQEIKLEKDFKNN